jgi:hypothetical protein
LIFIPGLSELAALRPSQIARECDDDLITPSDALPDDLERLKAMLLAEQCESERLRQIIKEMQERPASFGPTPPTIGHGAAVKHRASYLRARSQIRTAHHPSGGFKGGLQVDGYAGYRKLADRGEIHLAFCWSHVRHGFYELAVFGPNRSPANRTDCRALRRRERYPGPKSRGARNGPI